MSSCHQHDRIHYFLAGALQSTHMRCMNLDAGYLSVSRFIRVLLLGVQQLHPEADGPSALGKHQLDERRQRES